MKKLFISIIINMCLILYLRAGDAYAVKEGDTLKIGNDFIERVLNSTVAIL